MYTGEKLYWGRNRRKSIKGWIYSVAAALFLVFMATVLLAAKEPESGTDRTVKDAEDIEVYAESESVDEENAHEVIDVTEDENTQEVVCRHIPLIAVDAGHGGMDSGCLDESRRIMEKDINLQIAFLLRDKLEEKGCQVMMTRETDEMISKEDRVELANSHQAEVYVSIHQNTYEGKDKSVGGIETWYDGKDAARDNKALAECVHRETIKSTGAVERSLIDSEELYVLSKTLMPACLIETGFLSNPEECCRLSDVEYQEKLAAGIADGIITYLERQNLL